MYKEHSTEFSRLAVRCGNTLRSTQKALISLHHTQIEKVLVLVGWFMVAEGGVGGEGASTCDKNEVDCLVRSASICCWYSAGSIRLILLRAGI